jgi:ABC-2 type transport system ATP-binding protein
VNSVAQSKSAVVLDAVTKRFRHRPALFNLLGKERGGDTLALDGVSLRVPSGGILALLGPNGSGKTTTLKLVSTMLTPDSGSVTVFGADTSLNPEAVRRRVGFAVASERSFFPRLSGHENLDFFAALDDIPRRERPQRITRVLAEVGLESAADTLAMKYSSGMYQRLGIARALVKQPSVLLLDEPTRSLDPAGAVHVWELVRQIAQHGTTVLMATHNFEEAAAVADTVCVLHGGRVAGEQTLSVRTGVEQLQDLYFRATAEPAKRKVAEGLR